MIASDFYQNFKMYVVIYLSRFLCVNYIFFSEPTKVSTEMGGEALATGPPATPPPHCRAVAPPGSSSVSQDLQWSGSCTVITLGIVLIWSTLPDQN